MHLHVSQSQLGTWKFVTVINLLNLSVIESIDFSMFACLYHIL